MRAAAFFSALLLLAGCQEVEPDPGPDPSERALPSATATPASPTTPDVPLDAVDEDALVVVFFGDSLTAGHGLSDPDQAYPALVGEDLAEAGVPVRVVNAGISGDTSAGGLGRVAWTLRQNPPDVFVLALGANDGLRGTDPAATQRNLSAILDAVEEAAPDARLVVAGMEALPNMGADFADRFRAIFPAVAQAHAAALVPFLLDGVAGIARLNQSDGVHPTTAGHRIMAETVAEVVVPVARSVAG